MFFGPALYSLFKFKIFDLLVPTVFVLNDDIFGRGLGAQLSTKFQYCGPYKYIYMHVFAEIVSFVHMRFVGSHSTKFHGFNV